MTLRRKGNRVTGLRRGCQAADPYRRRNVHRVWNQIVLDEATKVALVAVPNVGVQPRCALLHQIGSQGDARYGDRFEQMANRCECITSADCCKDVVSFKGAQVRLDGFQRAPMPSWFPAQFAPWLPFARIPHWPRAGAQRGANPGAAHGFSKAATESAEHPMFNRDCHVSQGSFPVPTGRPRATHLQLS